MAMIGRIVIFSVFALYLVWGFVLIGNIYGLRLRPPETLTAVALAFNMRGVGRSKSKFLARMDGSALWVSTSLWVVGLIFVMS